MNRKKLRKRNFERERQKQKKRDSSLSLSLSLSLYFLTSPQPSSLTPPLSPPPYLTPPLSHPPHFLLPQPTILSYPIFPHDSLTPLPSHLPSPPFHPCFLTHPTSIIFSHPSSFIHSLSPILSQCFCHIFSLTPFLSLSLYITCSLHLLSLSPPCLILSFSPSYVTTLFSRILIHSFSVTIPLYSVTYHHGLGWPSHACISSLIKVIVCTCVPWSISLCICTCLLMPLVHFPDNLYPLN